jgi:hypothetical protein
MAQAINEHLDRMALLDEADRRATAAIGAIC